MTLRRSGESLRVFGTGNEKKKKSFESPPKSCRYARLVVVVVMIATGSRLHSDHFTSYLWT